jgi:hypothetical protein
MSNKRETQPDGTTVQYVRESGQWVKVTRVPKTRQWRIVRGWEGEVQAHDIHSWPFWAMRTWADALSMARQLIEDHAPNNDKVS